MLLPLRFTEDDQIPALLSACRAFLAARDLLMAESSDGETLFSLLPEDVNRIIAENLWAASQLPSKEEEGSPLPSSSFQRVSIAFIYLLISTFPLLVTHIRASPSLLIFSSEKNRDSEMDPELRRLLAHINGGGSDPDEEGLNEDIEKILNNPAELKLSVSFKLITILFFF